MSKSHFTAVSIKVNICPKHLTVHSTGVKMYCCLLICVWCFLWMELLPFQQTEPPCSTAGTITYDPLKS